MSERLKKALEIASARNKEKITPPKKITANTDSLGKFHKKEGVSPQAKEKDKISSKNTDSTANTDALENWLNKDDPISFDQRVLALKTQGYCEIPSLLLGTNIYVVKNDFIETPNAKIPRYTPSEIDALKGLPDKEIKLLHVMKVNLGGTISIPETPFADHLARYRDNMRHCDLAKNSEWKERFLDRVAPHKLICNLPYEKPTVKNKPQEKELPPEDPQHFYDNPTEDLPLFDAEGKPVKKGKEKNE